MPGLYILFISVLFKLIWDCKKLSFEKTILFLLKHLKSPKFTISCSRFYFFHIYLDEYSEVQSLLGERCNRLHTLKPRPLAF